MYKTILNYIKKKVFTKNVLKTPYLAVDAIVIKTTVFKY